MLNKLLRLSPSTLNLFLECSRCFWLQFNKDLHRPRGIFQSLPGGMDNKIKKYFDKYRGALPPEIKGKVKGTLISDGQLMNKWRNWRTGLSFEDKSINAALFGALDDCLREGDYYFPLDYKTRGYELKEDSSGFYQNQLDCYVLLLEKNGYQHKNLAYLVYYYPKEVRENGMVEFAVVPKEMKTDSGRAYQTLKKAVDILRGKEPKFHSECEYCSWGVGLEHA